MSQVYVEQVLGRLLTDAEFRDSFFDEPRACLLKHYSACLSDAEGDALTRFGANRPQQALDRLAEQVDPRIRRADLRTTKPSGCEWASSCTVPGNALTRSTDKGDER